jgi:predicted transcriptional regulator
MEINMAEPAESDLFETEDKAAKERAIAEARAEIAAGKGVPWADVKRWLQSWGKSDESPPPPWK